MTMAVGLCALHGLLGHVHREITAPAATSMPEPSLGTGAGSEVVLGAILICALVVLAFGFRAAVQLNSPPTEVIDTPAARRKG